MTMNPHSFIPIQPDSSKSSAPEPGTSVPCSAVKGHQSASDTSPASIISAGLRPQQTQQQSTSFGWPATTSTADTSVAVGHSYYVSYDARDAERKFKFPTWHTPAGAYELSTNPMAAACQPSATAAEVYASPFVHPQAHWPYSPYAQPTYDRSLHPAFQPTADFRCGAYPSAAMEMGAHGAGPFGAGRQERNREGDRPDWHESEFNDRKENGASIPHRNGALKVEVPPGFIVYKNRHAPFCRWFMSIVNVFGARLNICINYNDLP